MSNRDRANLGQDATPQQQEKRTTADQGEPTREAAKAPARDGEPPRHGDDDSTEEASGYAQPKEQECGLGDDAFEHRVAFSFVMA